MASALSAMTFALGRRFIIVDGVERWKEKELEPLEAALAGMPPDTTVAFFAREDSRVKAPARLHEAVSKAGGDVSAEENVKPWELPKWVIQRAARAGAHARAGRRPGPGAARRRPPAATAARAREAGALGAGPGARIDAAEIEELTAPSAERRAWSLADALVGAATRAQATRLYLALRAQGERLPGLLYWMASGYGMAHDVAQAIESGEPVAQIKRRLRMPGRAADRLIADARRARRRQAAARRSRRSPISSSPLAAEAQGAASEDTARRCWRSSGSPA